MCTRTITLEESYKEELKERIFLYSKNNGINQNDIPLETIIRILVEIRIERLKREPRPLFVNDIFMDDTDYDFMSRILSALQTQFFQINDENSDKRRVMIKNESEKQLFNINNQPIKY